MSNRPNKIRNMVEAQAKISELRTKLTATREAGRKYKEMANTLSEEVETLNATLAEVREQCAQLAGEANALRQDAKQAKALIDSLRVGATQNPHDILKDIADKREEAIIAIRTAGEEVLESITKEFRDMVASALDDDGDDGDDGDDSRNDGEFDDEDEEDEDEDDSASAEYVPSVEDAMRAVADALQNHDDDEVEDAPAIDNEGREVVTTNNDAASPADLLIQMIEEQAKVYGDDWTNELKDFVIHAADTPRVLLREALQRLDLDDEGKEAAQLAAADLAGADFDRVMLAILQANDGALAKLVTVPSEPTLASIVGETNKEEF